MRIGEQLRKEYSDENLSFWQATAAAARTIATAASDPPPPAAARVAGGERVHRALIGRGPRRGRAECTTRRNLYKASIYCAWES